MTGLDGTTGYNCHIYRGDRSEMPCSRTAVACLMQGKVPVCKRCMDEITDEGAKLSSVGREG